MSNWTSILQQIIDFLKSLFSPKPSAPPPEPTPQPQPEQPYIVLPGNRVERKMKVPCSLFYTITNKKAPVEDGGPQDNCHLAWAYSKEFGGGNTSPGGGFIAGIRDTKIKVYDEEGNFSGERRYFLQFKQEEEYRVNVQFDETAVTLKISDMNGIGIVEVSQTTSLPEEITVGYGWPPSQRPGPEGAKITQVSWVEA